MAGAPDPLTILVFLLSAATAYIFPRATLFLALLAATCGHTQPHLPHFLTGVLTGLAIRDISETLLEREKN